MVLMRLWLVLRNQRPITALYMSDEQLNARWEAKMLLEKNEGRFNVLREDEMAVIRDEEE